MTASAEMHARNEGERIWVIRLGPTDATGRFRINAYPVPTLAKEPAFQHFIHFHCPVSWRFRPSGSRGPAPRSPRGCCPGGGTA